MTTLNLNSECDGTKAENNDPINIGLIAEIPYISLVNTYIESKVCEESDTGMDESSESEATNQDWPSVWSSDVWVEKRRNINF